LDDPLSAVDAKVAQVLFTKTCLQMLKGKTIILVTHQTHFLTGCDRVVEADRGCLISHPP
jgi:ABC-type transport system involved in cytochrome bd biosynthesis fused ATPase/permease subunit